MLKNPSAHQLPQLHFKPSLRVRDVHKSIQHRRNDLMLHSMLHGFAGVRGKPENQRQRTGCGQKHSVDAFLAAYERERPRGRG